MKKQDVFRFLQLLLAFVLFWAGIRIYDYYKEDRVFDQLQKAFLQEADAPSMSTPTEGVALTEETKDEVPAVSRSAERTQSTRGSVEAVPALVQGVRRLKEIHPAIIGRIRLAGTVLDYPVVQGEDNEFYLNHDYRGEPHLFGAIFLSAENRADFKDLNSVVYGHNVRTGKMFDPLAGYLKEGFLEEHPIIEVITLDEVRRYRVFAAYLANPEDAYRRPRYSAEEWRIFGDYVAEHNVLETEPPTWGEARILTLSSCQETWNRLVVQAEWMAEIP